MSATPWREPSSAPARLTALLLCLCLPHCISVVSAPRTAWAGSACGLGYGLANDCEICSVKVVKKNRRSYWHTDTDTNAVVAGLNHIQSHCKASMKCVVLMDLQCGAPDEDSALYNTLTTLTDQGVVLVTNAGDSYSNACDLMPAAHPDVITVGSLNSPSSYSSTDRLRYNTNFGRCVDVSSL